MIQVTCSCGFTTDLNNFITTTDVYRKEVKYKGEPKILHLYDKITKCPNCNYETKETVSAGMSDGFTEEDYLESDH